MCVSVSVCVCVCVYVCVCPSFSFGNEDGVLDVNVLIPDHYLSIYFVDVRY